MLLQLVAKVYSKGKIHPEVVASKLNIIHHSQCFTPPSPAASSLISDKEQERGRGRGRERIVLDRAGSFRLYIPYQYIRFDSIRFDSPAKRQINASDREVVPRCWWDFSPTELAR